VRKWYSTGGEREDREGRVWNVAREGREGGDGEMYCAEIDRVVGEGKGGE
jgi:hypothetical protein